ncbi:RNA-binding region-containing protein 3 isoform X2 [Bombus vosnesenskii]|uniref:RNA-binding region-containing protein 3 n=2 Tax=Pyrobombus TaxID=144703 RepID=A0A6J3LNG7_9HYME|nr:RNA-binding region-containing protein 3 isoform X2 [Bombus vancouverensis nearcticus]XP_033303682.1 RNA-binding region-containing protein 3 isoform X2 [Bombus bifarius]XP_033365489.1 RNA-binding region-containing protein 3 isoform X2 [Bombus vosnesenskii]
MSSEIAHASDTLRILHLPPELSDERRNELFKKYGATKTRTLRFSKKYTITFAKFQSQEIATQALLRLHQLNVKGQYLTVEFAKKSMSIEKTENNVDNNKLTKEESKKESTNRSNFQTFLQKLNSWTMNQVFTQPPPPNIQYKYSAPTKGTLIRIAIQLLKEPVFYTQVLHLMNRMNLPPPFEELEAEFPALKEAYDIEKYNDIFIKESLYTKENEEEEESEIESNEEDNAIPMEIIPVKRKRPQHKKRLKIPKFINPNKQITSSNSTQKVVKPADMFEPVQRGETKNLKIELKMVDKLLDASNKEENTDSNNAADGGFGLMFPLSKPLDFAENSENTKGVEQKVITSNQLANNRISANDQRLLPVFKNYHPGKPSNRLYIKNLTKQVEEKDLHFIYRKYIVPELKTEFEYDVRLMQEGRMKGQAFITLQNVEQAQLALNETNGFILKDKPMVVQFAKISKS